MEKSKLVSQPHALLPYQDIIEVWYKGEMIATVYGADGPGVRILSKHPFDIIRGGDPDIGVIQVGIVLGG